MVWNTTLGLGVFLVNLALSCGNNVLRMITAALSLSISPNVVKSSEGWCSAWWQKAAAQLSQTVPGSCGNCNFVCSGWEPLGAPKRILSAFQQLRTRFPNKVMPMTTMPAPPSTWASSTRVPSAFVMNKFPPVRHHAFHGVFIACSPLFPKLATASFLRSVLISFSSWFCKPMQHPSHYHQNINAVFLHVTVV